MDVNNLITVLIPTSPIPSNPCTHIIDETIMGVRHHLPTAQIRILMDGVRPACIARTMEYEEYKRRLKFNCANGTYGNAAWSEWINWELQANMVRQQLQIINTPLIFFNEHDAPLIKTENPRDGRQDTLREDTFIDWSAICQTILDGSANAIRFYYVGERIHPEHTHMMQGEVQFNSATFMKTTQFSGWPHVSSTEFYRHILNTYYVPGKREMLECPIYTHVAHAPWEKFKTLIYYPEGNARRHRHSNGRALPDGSQEKADW